MELVEERLGKIVQNTKPKYSFLLTLSGKGSKLEKTFDPEISITQNCHYEIAFTSLETYYSMPNVDVSNNSFTIRKDGYQHNIVIPTGCYGLMDLNKEIGRQLREIDMAKAVEFHGNYNTYKCIMLLKSGYTVTFKENSLRILLGFEAKSYTAHTMAKRFESEHTVQILTINSILVNCDLVGGSYLNGKEVPVIHSFFPSVDPGEKIIEKPVEYIYLPVSSDVIRHMSVWLTDQDQKPLNLREENLTIKFHLRSC